MSELDKVTKRFASAYSKSKRAEAWLKKSQRRLFQELTKDLSQQTLAQKTITVPLSCHTDREILEYVDLYHPSWIIESIIPPACADCPSRVILKEDPSLLPHVYTNTDLGMVFGRSRVENSPTLDDERLKDEYPELWERISEWPEPWWTMLREVIANGFSMPMSSDVLSRMAADYLEAYGVQRVLKDLNTIDVDDLVLLQEYLVPGKVSVRLIPPRKVRDDE